MRVSMIGLGKLGLSTAVFFASRGCYVIGTDKDTRLVKRLAKGILDSREPGLSTLFDSVKDNMHFTDSIDKAVNGSSITFILVPTPSLPSGEFSDKIVGDVVREIGLALKKKKKYHLVVLISTVTPGSTRECVVRGIEAHSEKSCGEDFGVCYGPEFVAIGNILENLSVPDFILIGEYDKVSGSNLEQFYDKIFPPHSSSPPILRTSLENAELAKLAVNTFVTMKISYANMMAAICEQVPGMDSGIVTSIIGHDKRIGGKYLRPGLGFAGPCFPRDNRALVAFANRLDLAAPLPTATDVVNTSQARRIFTRINRVLPGLRKVAILGLSYKPDTDVVDDSPGLEFANLFNRIAEVRVFDRPEVIASVKKGLCLNGGIKLSRSIDTAVKGSDVVLITVQSPEFIPLIETLKPNSILFDPWRLLTTSYQLALSTRGVRYMVTGRQ